MSEIDDIALKAVMQIEEDLDDNAIFANIQDDTDIFNNIDSFTIVDLMLETEMLLEESLGRYVTLADETVFDADHSPLLRWKDWLQYVERRCAE